MKITKTHKIITAAVLLVIIAIIFWPEEKVENLYGTVQKGDFKIEVNTSGELKAKKSEDIKGPSSLRAHGIWQIKITDLVSEGTYVQVGDYVAQLDKSEVGNKIIAAATEVDKFTSQYEQTRLDTAIEMMKIRDDLINLKYETDIIEEYLSYIE